MLPIIQLGAHQLQPAPGDPVGPATGGRDCPFLFQLAKQPKIAGHIAGAIAGEADDLDNGLALVFFEQNLAALGEQVKIVGAVRRAKYPCL